MVSLSEEQQEILRSIQDLTPEHIQNLPSEQRDQIIELLSLLDEQR